MRLAWLVMAVAFVMLLTVAVASQITVCCALCGTRVKRNAAYRIEVYPRVRHLEPVYACVDETGCQRRWLALLEADYQ